MSTTYQETTEDVFYTLESNKLKLNQILNKILQLINDNQNLLDKLDISKSDLINKYLKKQITIDEFDVERFTTLEDYANYMCYRMITDPNFFTNLF